jgi:hypothetical protein
VFLVQQGGDPKVPPAAGRSICGHGIWAAAQSCAPPQCAACYGCKSTDPDASAWDRGKLLLEYEYPGCERLQETLSKVPQPLNLVQPPGAPSRLHTSRQAVPEEKAILSHTVMILALQEQGMATPQEGKEPATWYCYMLAAIACLNSCNLGYDVGSVGGAALLMRVSVAAVYCCYP